MIPIFSSQYSGKSILTFDLPEDAAKNHKQSIAKICIENNIQQPVIVDSKMTGVFQLFENFDKVGLSPAFGLTMKAVHSLLEGNENNWHKVVIFMKNKQGYKDLVMIHNLANIERQGFLTPDLLQNYWTDNLKLCIPFYDSYIFRNALYDVSCMPEFGDIPHDFFVENNGLPFDHLIFSKVPKNKKIKTKTILYEKKKDYNTWLTYRCALNFSNKGKNRTLSNPMFDHCASNEFCFESYLEKTNQR